MRKTNLTRLFAGAFVVLFAQMAGGTEPSQEDELSGFYRVYDMTGEQIGRAIISPPDDEGVYSFVLLLLDGPTSFGTIEDHPSGDGSFLILDAAENRIATLTTNPAGATIFDLNGFPLLRLLSVD